MGLMSKKMLLLAVVLAICLFAATVWLWPRLARRGVTPVLGRVGALLATQLSLLAALGLAANTYFGFYGSWADLFGQETTPGTVIDHTTADAASQLRVIELIKASMPGGGTPRKAGRIEKVLLGGSRSGITSPAFVYLPPEYFTQPHRVFPAAVVLTGYPGTAESLYRRLKYPSVATSQVRQGIEQPMVLIMMRPTVVPPRDTECVDVPGGPRTETYFAKDLPAAIRSHYRVGSGPGSWGIIGDSTGGYCALKLALQDPGSYSAAVALSADYVCPEDRTTGDLFGGSAAVRRANNLPWRLTHLPQPPVSLLVTSSRHGERNYRATEHFISLVKGPTRVSAIILPSGGHNLTTWGRELPAAMRWLSDRLVPDAPPAGKAPAKAPRTVPVHRVQPGHPGGKPPRSGTEPTRAAGDTSAEARGESDKRKALSRGR
ncbi:MULTISPECIES: alpha/beta hydrolase [unclassified Streptomyces]|uniref:alpha/beta hydrolase n=1 Tax=unclassified Streptomyces TaxID=2593676 RepID=UPI002E2C1C6F|nr:alpha/beta hydrolase-fold protein [Streptomyces sp. NBC_00223]